MATKEQSFTFETMAVVLCCMLKSGITLGNQHYEMMSKLDGKRGKDAFQHQFRKVKTHAQELLKKLEDDPTMAIATPVKLRNKKFTSGDDETPTPTPKSKKRSTAKSIKESDLDEAGDSYEVLDDAEFVPSKRIKSEAGTELY